MEILRATDLAKSYFVYVKDDQPRSFGLRGLFRRKRQQVLALRALNLSMQKGEILGLIGENGSGKSTTIKLLTGILKPSGGKVAVSGIDPFRSRIANAQRIGAIMGQKTQLWWDLPVIRSFEMLKVIYRIPDDQYASRLVEFSELMSLGGLLQKPVRTLSLGQRVRCDVAAGLLHNPEIVFLDEPTIGLDFRVKEALYAFLRHCNQNYGTTIILTSHDLEDVERMCNRLAILEGGECVYDGQMRDFMQRLGGDKTVTVQLDGGAAVDFDPGFGHVLERTDHSLRVSYDSRVMTELDVYRRIGGLAGVRDIGIADVQLKDILLSLH